MYLHGTFMTQRGEIAKVEILTGGSRAEEIEFGLASGVIFTSDPVEIICETDDDFDHIIRSSASIRLMTRGYIPELYCDSVLDAVVNISIDGVCVFAGYIIPQSYTQAFSRVYDEFEINCIDALSALQYLRYRNVGNSGVDYNAIRSSASVRSFGAIVQDVMQEVMSGLDLSGDNGSRVLYDGSITIPRNLLLVNTTNVFQGVGISELLFLGEDEKEAWSSQEVLAEIMRYLNLRIHQDGLDFRIYSFDTVKRAEGSITWKLFTGTVLETVQPQTVTVTTAIASGKDATISVGEVYNRIELTCEVKEMDSLVESPLDSENVSSPFTNRQLYMREYSCEPLPIFGQQIFKDLVNELKFDNSLKQSYTDWYMRVYESMQWKFLSKGEDLVAKFCSTGTHQENLPLWLGGRPGAALVAFGSVKKESGGKDNSLQGKIDMETSLYVPVNGNGKDSETESYPTDQALLEASPVAEYIGNVSGGVFTPADNTTVNYIVFTGKVVLNPLLRQIFSHADAPWLTGTWPNITEGGAIVGQVKTVPGKDGSRVYCTKWFSALYPQSEPEPTCGPGLMPFTDDAPEEYEFKYSAVKDYTDNISKVGVLACMLIIGDKCVVESGYNGSPNDFEWKTYKTREQCATDDEYYAQSFTLGFDPKVGDKLIGHEFDIQNNIDYNMGLEMEGTAIPIRKTDKVSGKVSFRILGPVNVTWDEVTSRHKTWFRKEKWSSNAIPLMAHVQNIVIKDFEVKVCSDNGLIDSEDDNDLIYVSDTDETFVNVKDDLTFRITTALTRAERQALGVSDSLKLSSPVFVSTGDPVTEVKNEVTGDEGKPEQLYVDSSYRECRRPLVTLSHKLRSDSGEAGWFNRYSHPALPGKEFYVRGISRGLAKGWVELKLKEIEDD